jgi:hypothetical protein
MWGPRLAPLASALVLFAAAAAGHASNVATQTVTMKVVDTTVLESLPGRDVSATATRAARKAGVAIQVACPTGPFVAGRQGAKRALTAGFDDAARRVLTLTLIDAS